MSESNKAMEIAANTMGDLIERSIKQKGDQTRCVNDLVKLSKEFEAFLTRHPTQIGIQWLSVMNTALELAKKEAIAAQTERKDLN